MRCKNCGWENPANNLKCEKCNASLAAGLINKAAPENSSPEESERNVTKQGCPDCGYPMRELKKTCPNCGRQFDKEEDQSADKKLSLSDSLQPLVNLIPEPHIPVGKICVRCKSPVSESASYCSNCGSSLTNENNLSNKTINPWAQSDPIQIAEPIQVPTCTLNLRAGDGESLKGSTLQFMGDVIPLNRSNTEPANPTITSQVQAELSFENNKWYIQDKSALKTTYIYTGEKKELKQGDVVVLGNRAFEFNCE